MILNSTKFGGNRTKDVEVGPDRRTDRQTIPIFAGSINISQNVVFLWSYEKNIQ
jgi:hypothetical protein